MALINPDDPRLGNRRQQLTRSRINMMLDEERRRRQRGMSRFSRMGQARQPRSRSPFRGAGAGTRFGIGQRVGGLAQFLSGRGGPGQTGRRYIEPPVNLPPRVQPPAPPTQLPGDPGRETLSPELLDIIRDPGPQGLPEGGPSLGGAGGEESLIDPGVSLSGGGGEQTFQGGVAGLIPLGNGLWFNPATGTLHGGGAGGSGFRAL